MNPVGFEVMTPEQSYFPLKHVQELLFHGMYSVYGNVIVESIFVTETYSEVKSFLKPVTINSP